MPSDLPKGLLHLFWTLTNLMIIGLIIRNFKVYKKINYIPLSKGSNFNGLIGMNGIGKSSILEALDCFFNQKPWILNIESKYLNESWVMPVIALKKSDFDFEDLKELAEKVTSYVLSDDEGKNAVENKNYAEHIKSLRNNIPSNLKQDYYILPICLDGNFDVSFGIFNTQHFKQSVFLDVQDDDEKQRKQYKLLYDKILSMLTYVYVPKDIEAERFVSFENRDLQHLIGKELTEIVSKSLSKEAIGRISSELKSFVDNISSSLGGYKFKARSSYQPNLKPYKIYDLIIEEFFSLRALFKETNAKDIPLVQLSSGEKQQAIIQLITRLVTKYRDSNKGLIVAVDEPESSLHVSLCYDQFEKLYEVSQCCSQILYTSHWYGFIPTLTCGSILNISYVSGIYDFNIFNADNYREEIKFADREHNGKLPIDVMVKSSNDLVQSILSSIIRDDCYNWILCEGSSDKIYMTAYLEDEIVNKRLRIIPVCKASEIKKMYEHLSIAIEELKDSVKGRVYMLTDTDAQLLEYDTKDGLEKHIICRRIVNEGDITRLVKIKANPKSPKTDIEDALNGRLFHKILVTFKPTNEELSFLDEKEREETSSYSALDLRPKEYEKMDQFFSKGKGMNKVLFANEYVKTMQAGEYKIPGWIEEIKRFFNA